MLSRWFEKHGKAPVERQPIIGRTGPDITWNDVKLMVDAKNRLQVPKGYRISDVGIYQFGLLIGVRMRDLDLLLSDEPVKEMRPASITVSSWFNHNAEWNQMPFGSIPALIIRQPVRGWIREDATFLIRKKDRELLKRRMNVTG